MSQQNPAVARNFLQVLPSFRRNKNTHRRQEKKKKVNNFQKAEFRFAGSFMNWACAFFWLLSLFSSFLSSISFTPRDNGGRGRKGTNIRGVGEHDLSITKRRYGPWQNANITVRLREMVIIFKRHTLTTTLSALCRKEAKEQCKVL